MKSSLAVFLAVAQLLSWSASPIYLCCSSDGAVCFDSGPDACACCGNTCPDHDSCCGGEREHDGDHRACSAGCQLRPRVENERTVLAHSGCNCTHIFLAGPQEPFVVSSGSQSQADVLSSVILDGDPCGHAPAFIFAADVDPGARELPVDRGPHLWLDDVRAAVMRC